MNLHAVKFIVGCFNTVSIAPQSEGLIGGLCIFSA